jgi:ABC-type sugar transport system substrate-binding protein
MPRYIPQKLKSLVSLLTMFILLFVAGVLVQSAHAQEKKLIAIIVPSPENPFFKALADAAEMPKRNRLDTIP